MGIFTRFSDIVNSNLHALLDKAEDPEKMVRLIIQEMEDTLVEVRSTAARTIADRKAVQRHIAHWREEAADWAKKAELAVSRDREDLARAALVEKQQADEQMVSLDEEDGRLGATLEQLNEDIARLQSKLDDARSRQKSLIQRRQAASTRLEARRHVHDRRLDDALSRFEGYEQRLDHLEGEAEALDMGRGESEVRQAFRDLESSESVESELEALKARVKGRAKSE
ncbi:phage shock protein PspA [Natronospira bacteriovora]|uniref:Phage shock protein PspA n=1 Tax=Natronospira bacteriovora TaxID=3069753 RepID=A0ABU0W8D7_9GAMM|nr:phage shock protein PspA [Natronospira sp. AB-CW4]MDQ2070295.1 phage shock protein PspA [Natronospira sp. AB-CW4]